ncbi:Rv3654c family TadE-like protein [Dactylosporangium sp. CS-033363]|uniref:Rv3654c family TadE-like protein n=1 Tax=Dactylosporangium sp. CS-033363 TaxID=3239935 RepID=UPI003D909987
MRPRPRESREARERGSAGLICLAVGLALAALAVGISTGGGVVVAAHRARNAADASALAGALTVSGGSAVACAAAERLAGENHGRLMACVVSGPIVTVTVEVWTRSGLKARASARAGPVDSVRGGPEEEEAARVEKAAGPTKEDENQAGPEEAAGTGEGVAPEVGADPWVVPRRSAPGGAREEPQ